MSITCYCNPFQQDGIVTARSLLYMQGVLRVGQKIEVRPGITTKDESGGIKCTPIFSRIISLFAEKNELQFAVPGGLIGVGTTIDPTLTRADRLVGQVLGEVGELPDVYVELEVTSLALSHYNIYYAEVLGANERSYYCVVERLTLYCTEFVSNERILCTKSILFNFNT